MQEMSQAGSNSESEDESTVTPRFDSAIPPALWSPQETPDILGDLRRAAAAIPVVYVNPSHELPPIFGVHVRESSHVPPGRAYVVNEAAIAIARTFQPRVEALFSQVMANAPSPQPQLTPLGEIAYGKDTGGCWRDTWDEDRGDYIQCGKPVDDDLGMCPECRADLQAIGVMDESDDE